MPRGLVVFLLAAILTDVWAASCVENIQQVGRPVRKLNQTEKLIFNQIECDSLGTILYAIEGMSATERALCGDQYVPFGVHGYPLVGSVELNADFCGMKNEESMTRLLSMREKHADEYGLTFGWGAINLTSGRWHLVQYEYEFDCTICQVNGITLPIPVPQDIHGERTPHAHYKVILTSKEPRENADVTAKEQAILKKELIRVLKPNLFGFTHYNSSTLDDQGRVRIQFHVDTNILKTVAYNNQTQTVLGNYTMAIEDVSVCPAEETVDANGTVTVWPTGDVRFYRLVVNLTRREIVGRDCLLDDVEFRGIWSSLLTFYELAWTNCTDDEQYVNKVTYAALLDPEIASKHGHQLQRFTLTPINTTTLKAVSQIVNREVDLMNELSDQMSCDLANITANLILDASNDSCFVMATRVYLIIADQGGRQPVVGFTLEYMDGSIAGNINLTLDRTQTGIPLVQQQFSLSVSDGLASIHGRLAFVAMWKEIQYQELGDNDGVNLLSENRHTQFLEVNVLLLKPIKDSSVMHFALHGEYFVDIAFKEKEGKKKSWTGTPVLTACSAWSHELGQWVTDGCHHTKAPRGSITVCRCSAKYFASMDGVAVAKFALKKDFAMGNTASIINFFKESTALVVVTVVECILSATGFLSIILTAIFFSEWRQNTGHKILLHMLAALTCNLVLGVVTSFLHLDTESVGCLVIGVLRHYSFLAMFLWMLVLSGLQMKRLLTIAGAKATTHLISKVASFAWGGPLLPIGTLLAWNTRFYQTDRFDRGYCYPEGLVFELTVQAPAGIILVVNGCIFIKIVTHIFDCGVKKKITKHSKNERAEQLNKLKTSFFIFFLFGFTWIFHFLSEERVISSDFMFEYLFLMTATTHIFILALFFIVLQENTRNNWVKCFKSI